MAVKTNYKKWLDESYAQELERMSKLCFVADNIFGFTTYDPQISESFGLSMLEVIQVILAKRNFEYQQNRETYLTYMMMVNMPFLIDKLEWGTSIHGAWINKDEDVMHDINGLMVHSREMSRFLTTLLTWVRKQ
jgi:hypothetical protein